MVNIEEKVLEAEKEILKEERKILKQEKRILSNIKTRNLIEIGIAALLLIAVVSGGYYWFYVRNRIFTDKAQISAPLIDLSPSAPGVLKQILVKEGDIVPANTAVARVESEYITTNTTGLVVGINNEIGKLFSPGMPVVQIINPRDLRITALIDENAGFADIRIGERAVFTVDAFGSRQYEGTVDEIGHTAHESSVVFSISDKRPTKQFEVKIQYDATRYPELLNGMSARVWIYK